MNLIMWLMPYGGDRMVGGTKWARRDEDATVGGEAGDAVNACGFDGYGVVGRTTRAGRDPRRAVAGPDGDAVDTRGLNRLGEGHRR